MNIEQNIELILTEIGQALRGFNNQEIEEMNTAIAKANTVVVCGAGRTGFIASTFAMRLYQLGLKAFTHKDENLPEIQENDVVIVCSGSGETESVREFTKSVKAKNAIVIFVTTEDGKTSSIGKLADRFIILQTPSKLKTNETVMSSQPLGSLYEQSLFIFFEALVLSLMEKLNQTHEDMKQRYVNLH